MDSILSVVESYGAPGVCIVLVLCSFGFPMAKSLVIVGAGILAAARGNGLPLFIGCCLGLHGGDFIMFMVGRSGGESILSNPLVRRIAPPESVAKTRALIARHGAASLLVARVVPFIRALCYLLLGVLRMNPLLFTLVNLTAACVYSALFFAMGMLIGNNPERIFELYRSGNLVFVVVALAIAGGLVWKRRRSQA